MTAPLTPRQLQFLQHSLGCDQYGRGAMYRNHFVTDETGTDGRVCLELVALRLMSNDGPRSLCGGMSVFHVTSAGREAMRSQSPEPPPPEKLTPGKRRYLEYIRADSGLSFREWMGFKNERRKERSKR
jgi:hypothetical protein